MQDLAQAQNNQETSSPKNHCPMQDLARAQNNLEIEINLQQT